jgi:LacI family transcriptional regulator
MPGPQADVALEMTATVKVALLIETSNAYARGLISGIVSYIREHQRWSIYLAEHRRGENVPSWLAQWKGDGVLARIENASISATLAKVRKPIVDMSSARLIPSLPWVETDDAAVARLAADHLLERGFKHFAFIGDRRYNWSRWRQQHFTRLIKEAGYDCAVYCFPAVQNRSSEELFAEIGARITRWPKPIGVMAAFDVQGQQILDACRRCSIQVPDEVAVIGVDNDELYCALSDPPLSSVILNAHRAGYEAAALLDRMIAGEKIKGEGRLFEPIGVATRQSTDVLAIKDRNLVQAIRFIRQNACSGISMKDVLRVVPQSRRVLESHFQQMIGRTPHEEIIRVRLNRVKTLLTESDLPLETIAEQAGFAHVEYLSVVFRQKIGLPPSRYRTLNRRKPIV